MHGCFEDWRKDWKNDWTEEGRAEPSADLNNEGSRTQTQAWTAEPAAAVPAAELPAQSAADQLAEARDRTGFRHPDTQGDPRHGLEGLQERSCRNQ